MARLSFEVFSRTFRFAYRRAQLGFLADLASPERAQQRLLLRLVQDLSTTDYGRHYRLPSNADYRRFTERVPIVDYDALMPWIKAQQVAGGPVLCPGGAVFHERTSGSSGASKDIPYTRALQASFVRMFLLWAHDTLENGPRLRSGRTFLSVSPNLAAAPTSLQDDTDYLSPALRFLIGHYLVLPRGLRQVTHADSFKRILAACLLCERELEVVSVWSPTYFSSLIEFIEANRGKLAKDLRAGEIETDGRVFRLAASAAQRRRSATILESGSLELQVIWPHLRILSCWTDGNAALVLEPLLRRLPHAVLQSKGLIATEAPMTIPLWHAPGPVPLLSEVFFELAGADGSIRQLHDAHVGERYDLIISQRGGLARYRIGDQVEVGQAYYRTPTLRFVGRSHQTSDLVGEKLNENFVRDTLNSVPRLSQERWMLVPAVADGRARYVCLVEGPQPAADLADTIDETLQRAHHYRLARRLGQLAPVSVERHQRLDDSYLSWSTAQGRKWGNVKPCALIADPGRAVSFLQYLRSAEKAHG